MSWVHAQTGDEGRPERIGPYRVLDGLGAGGMGVVYRAQHVSSGRVVALKTVHAQGEAVLAGIRREIHALRALDHPGVVRIVDDGLEGGVPWYAMEVLEGPTLRRPPRERVESAGATPAPGATDRGATPITARGIDPFAGTAPLGGVPTPRPSSSSPLGARAVREALTSLRAVCATLAFVHGRGVVHRDLKPDNVILTPDRGPVIVDFGIAAHGLGAHGREVLHATGRAAGSPGYMAPEQILGEMVDARADLYAVGCMLFEAITGRLPFDGESAHGVLSRKVHDEPPSPRALAPGLPDALERLVVRLLARRPQDRLGHADDVCAALAALGADPPTVEGPPAEPYLYRPGLAGRAEIIESIERVLSGASALETETAIVSEGSGPIAPFPFAPATATTTGARLSVAPSGSAHTLAFTAAGVTLDVSSGRAAAVRRGGFILIGGESGVGKTRLALEMTARAAHRGFRVVTGQCERVGAGDQSSSALRAAPLHPLRDLFHAIADRCRTLGPAAHAQILGERGPLLAPFEPALADLPGHDRYAPPADLPPEAARTRLHDALSETLRAFAESEPVMLVLDDLQWADEHTLRFLGWLDEAWFADTPVVVLATYRLEEVSPELAVLLGKKGVVREKLARLDERAVARIVRDMLAVDQPDARLVGYLHRHTEGNPFFVAEYLRTAIARQLLLRDEAGRWRVNSAAAAGGELERLPLPATLRELVALRLEGLGADALEVARMVAVVGREVDLELLAEALGGAAALQPSAVLELVRRHVLEEPEPGLVRLLHDKLREALYAGLPRQERVRLHARAARALRGWADRRGELDRLAPELAHHHAESGAVAEALGFLDQAAERAMGTGAAADGLRSFELAASIFDEKAAPETRRALADRRVRWERRAAEAHHALGNLPSAEERGRAAIRLATGATTLLDLRIEEGGVQRARFVAGAAVAVGKRVLALAVERPGGGIGPLTERWREASLAADRLAETYLFLNDAHRAGVASVLATNFAARVGASPELARGHAKLAVACAYISSERLALAYVARAERVATELGDPLTSAVVAMMCGYWSIGAGHLPDAVTRLGSALDHARSLSDRRREEEALALLAVAATLQGRLDDALARYAEVEASSRRSRNAQGQLWAKGGRAIVWGRLGRIDEAIATFADVDALIDSTSDRTERIQVGLTAPLHLRRGDRERAREVAEETLDLLVQSPPSGCQLLPGVVGTCDTLMALWTSAPPGHDRRELEAKARRSVEVLEGFARFFPIGLPDALRARAAWLAAHARLDPIVPMLQRAAAEAQRMGMPIEEGRARLALALRLPHEPRARELATARSLLRQCRAHFYLPEVEAAAR